MNIAAATFLYALGIGFACWFAGRMSRGKS